MRYLENGSYNNAAFYRVVKNFIIQAGGINANLEQTETFPPIKNESDNNTLSNVRGSIAMARAYGPDTATNQFYINVVNNSSALDPNPSIPGYAVFGNVIEGMDIVDAISNLPIRKHHVQNVGMYYSVPKPLVIINETLVSYVDAKTRQQNPQRFSSAKIKNPKKSKSSDPIYPYTKDIATSPSGWREKLKLQFYIWLKPLFPGYVADSYHEQYKPRK